MKLTYFCKNSISGLSHALIFDRLSVQAVHLSAAKRSMSHRFYNNLLIGINYAAIVGRYSKCYLCKFSPVKFLIRQVYGMNELDQHISSVNVKLLESLPNQLNIIKKLSKFLKYPQKNLHSSLGLVLGQKGNIQTQAKYLTAIQTVAMGFQMHYSVGGSFSPNSLVRIGLTLLRKVIKDKYLVLAGDYLHIRGSVLASSTGNIELPKLLAETEVALCKQVYLRDELRNKIAVHGYECITIQEIHQIYRLRAALTSASLRGISILRGLQFSAELFEAVGLLVLYRQQLQQFMFNFPRLFNRFLEIKTGNGIFCEQYTMTQYLFFQSTQKTSIRLDLAYLNTVHLLSQQIRILESKIRKILGQSQYGYFMNRLKYVLIMYS